MATNNKTIKVQLNGIRPLMFDRYAGDNSTSLPNAEKMYLTDDRQLIIPALNVLSLLAAENGKSVAKVFFGKNWRNIALGISSYTNVNPFEIPVLDDDGPIYFEGFNQQISVHKSVARLAKGIPNPKERPLLALPWRHVVGAKLLSAQVPLRPCQPAPWISNRRPATVRTLTPSLLARYWRASRQ